MMEKQGNNVELKKLSSATFSEPSLVPLQPATAEDPSPSTFSWKRGPS